MTTRFAAAVAAAVLLAASPPASGASEPETVELVVGAGTPLRVVLDQRVRVKRAGQAVSATVVEPVYAFDRIVVPAGARVVGHIAKLEPPSKGTRWRSLLGGDFSPPRRVVLSFNTLVLPGGAAVPIETTVTSGAAGVTRAGKGRRVKRWLRDALVGALPFRPQYIREDAAYNVKLVEPLRFGRVAATAPAPAGVAPAPGSVLTARLVTPLHSAKTPPATPIEAIVTRPVLSADQRLILPEGTRLRGEVTFARPARRFHRNGQLRILFESVEAPERDSERRLASLHSVEAGRGSRVRLDEEGGATVANSDARFVAPALASLALAASFRHKLDYDTDGAGPELAYGSTGSSAAGGFFGLGLAGAGIAQLGRPAAVGLAVVGMARTLYGSVAGKGQDVSFPADTAIQVQLAPGPSASPGPAPTPSPGERP